MKRTSKTIFTAKTPSRQERRKAGYFHQVVRFSWRLGVLAVILLLPSCFGLDKDMGLTEVTDVQAREGAGGTLDNPAPLDPFQRYDLVLAANECRVFSMKVPAKWSWSISLTVANREDGRRGKLTAEILGQEPNWLPLPACYMSKTFDLSHEGSEVRMGVHNPGDTNTVNFQLCQTGAPLRGTMVSQISATKGLVVPGATPLPDKNP